MADFVICLCVFVSSCVSAHMFMSVYKREGVMSRGGLVLCMFGKEPFSSAEARRAENTDWNGTFGTK